MHIQEIAGVLKEGLSRAWHTNFAQGGIADAPIRPEYLVSVLLASAFVDHLDAPRSAIVKLEVSTNEVAGAAIGYNRTAGQMGSISRPGKVDVVVGVPLNGVSRPVILVEAKRYITGFSGISEDVDRLLEFLLLSDDGGASSIVAGASAFLLVERHLTRDDQHEAIKARLQKIGKEGKSAASAKGVETSCFYHILHEQNYPDEAAANMPDGEGRPAILSDEPVMIVGGMLLFHRADQEVKLEDISISGEAAFAAERLSL